MSVTRSREQLLSRVAQQLAGEECWPRRRASRRRQRRSRRARARWRRQGGCSERGARRHSSGSTYRARLRSPNASSGLGLRCALPVRRAGGTAEPAGRGASGRGPRARLPGSTRARGRRGRRRKPDRLDDGKHPAGSSRGARVRACRSSSAPTSTPCSPRRLSSRSSETTGSCATPPARSWRRRQVRRRLHAGGVARLIEEERPHAGVELLFTPKEEVGLVGAGAFDETRLAARLGYVYDHAGPVGEVILGAPYQRRIDVRFQGRAAHAGCTRRRVARRSRRPRERSQTCAWVGLTTRPRRTWARSRVGPRATSFRSTAGSPRRPEATTSGSSPTSSRRWWTRSPSPPGSASARSRSQVGDATPGYRFRGDDLPVQLALTALRRSGREPSFILSGGAPTRTSSTNAASSASTSRTG